MLAFMYNCFYVPVSICFNYEPVDALYGIDVLAITIYILDILVRANTALINENSVVESDIQTIRHTYINAGLFLEVLSAIPIDLIAFYLNTPMWTRSWFRCLRFIKIVRLYRLIHIISPKIKQNFMAYNLTVYLVLYIYLNHFAACIFFYIGKIQLEEHPNDRFDNRTWMSVFGEPAFHDYEPILDMSMIDQYIHSLYWAYATCGTVAYGDIIPVTPTEKIYGFIVMIIAKIFVAFIYAESASLVSGANVARNQYEQKKTMVKQWMTHIKL